MRQNILVCFFSIHSLTNCFSLTKYERQISQGSVRNYSGKVKHFALLYGQFTQDNM